MEVRTCPPDDPLFKSLKQGLYPDPKLPTVPEPDRPHLHSCFLVTENGRAISRAALFTNPAQGGMRQRCAQVGSFESDANQAAVDLLFKAISREAKEWGAKTLIGPMNGSTWHSHRFNDDEIRPFFSEFVHPSYYPGLWIANGFQKLAGYYSARSEHIQKTKLKQFDNPPAIQLRTIDLAHYENELSVIHDFTQKAFAGNFLFSPISKEDFLTLYLPLKEYIDPRLVLLAESANGLAGMAFGLPNHYDSPGKSMIIKTLARMPGGDFRGLGNFLARRIYLRAQELQFEEIIHAFMLRDGQSTQVSGQLYGKPFREYSLYKKEL